MSPPDTKIIKIIGQSAKMEQNILKTISQMREVKDRFHESSENFNTVFRPTITNMGLIPNIYKTFSSIFKEDAYTSEGKKKFLFVVLYLYAPLSIFGGKIPKGLRRSIGEVLGIKSYTCISNMRSEILVLYTCYSDFRNDVDKVIGFVSR